MPRIPLNMIETTLIPVDHYGKELIAARKRGAIAPEIEAAHYAAVDENTEDAIAARWKRLWRS